MPNIMWIEWAIIAAIVAILGSIAFFAVQDSRRPGFELKKADWACSNSHEEATTTYMNMGDGKTIVLMPITTTTRVCDQWSRVVQ